MIIGFILCFAALWIIGALARRSTPPPPDYAGAILAVMERVEQQGEEAAQARAELDALHIREGQRARLALATAEVIADRAGIRLEIGQPVKSDETLN